MNITIVGGGNIGTLMAAEMAHKGHRVTIYTSRAIEWNDRIEVYNEKEELLYIGFLEKKTDNLEEALREAEYIFITMPAQLFDELAKKILPYVEKGQKIGIVPGSGGAEFAFRAVIEKGCILFGFQRVHSIARLKRYGASVYQLGRKTVLQLGAIPKTQAEEICAVMEQLLNMPCKAVENYLSVTLTPSNPILHTARLYSMFREYKKGDFYKRNFLFYEEWTDDASRWLLACDQELQKLCKVIPLDLGEVHSLKQHYGAQTEKEMTDKIRSIPAFYGIYSPMKKTKFGWTLDWQSRYFLTDFSFGIQVLREIARLFKVPVPNMDLIWRWYDTTAEKKEENRFHLNIAREDFLKLYQRI